MNVKNLKTDQSRTVSFLNNIKSKTSDSHKKLESLPISKAIIDIEITNEQYALYLSLMLDVVQNFENDIYPILSDIVSDLQDRKKASLIVNDLNAIGIQKKQTISPFEKDSIPSKSFAMGMLYVIEGSTLGGRFILKNIQESLGYTNGKGASYFSGYGNKTGSFWKSFLETLTDFELKTNSEEEIIKGADFAFNVIYKHLSTNAL